MRRLAANTEAGKIPNTKFWNGSSGKAGTSMAGYKEHTKKSSISMEGESSNRRRRPPVVLTGGSLRSNPAGVKRHGWSIGRRPAMEAGYTIATTSIGPNQRNIDDCSDRLRPLLFLDGSVR